MEDTPLQNGEFKLLTSGQRLREARQAAGIEISEVAAKTRIPVRHLEAVEEGRFDDLPGRTYAIGFSKAYAKVVDLPEDEFLDDLREEMSEAGVAAARSSDPVQYAAEDPSKVPSAKTAWIIAIVGFALVAGGYTLWRYQFFPTSGISEMADNAAEAGSDQSAAAGPSAAAETDNRPTNGAITAPATGDVVFTATEDNVWVKFYDGSGKQLMQKQMVLGEQYVVPADADNPQIWTGRPDAFAITIGGEAVPPLGTADRSIKDVPISAAALLARSAATEDSPSE
ncbi:MAG: RodZ domain-containing protein [Pseudomonadota bacterium]